MQIGKIAEDYWVDIPFLHNSGESTGYPTQKPFKLLERIIKASSDEGDIVLDPFCGSGTTLVAAHSLNRRYYGFDVNQDAVNVARGRIQHE